MEDEKELEHESSSEGSDELSTSEESENNSSDEELNLKIISSRKWPTGKNEFSAQCQKILKRAKRPSQQRTSGQAKKGTQDQIKSVSSKANDFSSGGTSNSNQISEKSKDNSIKSKIPVSKAKEIPNQPKIISVSDDENDANNTNKTKRSLRSNRNREIIARHLEESNK